MDIPSSFNDLCHIPEIFEDFSDEKKPIDEDELDQRLNPAP